jgi:hypothetical protein
MNYLYSIAEPDFITACKSRATVRYKINVLYARLSWHDVPM